METTTLIYLLVAIVAVLVLIVAFLVWRMSCKNDELQKKDDIIASIDTGAGALTIGWPGWYKPTAETTGDYIALRGAAHAGDPSYNANVYGSWTVGIAANSTKKEQALDLLKYLMDPDVQYSTIELGGVPCRFSSLQDEKVLETYPQYAAVCEALQNGIYRPAMEEWTEFYTILGTEIDYIINGMKTVEEGLNDAQEQLEDLLEEEKEIKKKMLH